MVKISVIMNTYNRENMIKAAIDSVIANTEKDWELLVNNDGSTDSTADILKEYAKADNRIKPHNRKTNSGRNLSLVKNEMLAKAKGDYICFIDDDNQYEPAFLGVMSACLDRNPLMDVYYCDSNFWHQTSDKEFTCMGRQRSIDFNRETLKRMNIIDLGEVMCRRKVFDKYKFDEKITYCGEDWVLWIQASKDFEFYHYPELLTNYFVHSTQTTKDPKHAQTVIELRRRIDAGEFE